jgi:hypothetical protein
MGLSIGLASFAFKLATPTHSAYLLRLDAQPEAIDAWRFWQGQPTDNHLLALAFKPEHANPFLVKAQRADWLARA